MTDNKKTEEVRKDKKQGGNFIKSFLLITALFVMGIYLVMQARPDLVENIYPNKTQNTNTPEIDNELVKEALEGSYSVGAEPPVMSFAPEAEEESVPEIEKESDAAIEEDDSSHPYEEIVDVEAKAFDSSALKNKFNEYRIFLNNANNIIAKHESGDNSDLEIKLFKKHIHPAHINETISLFEAYNKLLIKTPAEEPKKPSSVQAKLLEKFVKIRKIDSVDGELLDIKSKNCCQCASWDGHDSIMVFLEGLARC